LYRCDPTKQHLRVCTMQLACRASSDEIWRCAKTDFTACLLMLWMAGMPSFSSMGSVLLWLFWRRCRVYRQITAVFHDFDGSNRWSGSRNELRICLPDSSRVKCRVRSLWSWSGSINATPRNSTCAFVRCSSLAEPHQTKIGDVRKLTSRRVY
jgi:hypothetical protein